MLHLPWDLECRLVVKTKRSGLMTISKCLSKMLADGLHLKGTSPAGEMAVVPSTGCSCRGLE